MQIVILSKNRCDPECHIMETNGYYVGAVKNPRFANSEYMTAYKKEVQLMNYKNKQ